MELREFAEQVLFATTLEEKLGRPGTITDEHPGAPLLAPLMPGRPAALRFKTAGAATADFPGLRRLGDEQERGRVLHFFANHELLATELMALVLLRFPDAPAAFRRGVLRTLQEEQIHTRLYLERMKACGLEFGELPVSGYFWRSVSSMESPLDYVAGLSLTFEQANLDFARQFAQGFTVVGDDITARLLERIYRDEIGHVAYGLKWFRRWKNPKLSDWEAYCAQLRPPLSPQRAKGGTLNVEGRRAAGLDQAFITELDVFARSRGRTPGVFLFNPFAEGYLARGRSFSPVKHQALLANDLANLPQFLCRKDDLVLVPARPSTEFLESIQKAGIALPEFVELERGRIPMTGTAGLAGRKLGQLRPWAWGSDSVELLEPLFPQLPNSDACPFKAGDGEQFHRLYSKAWSAELLGEFLSGRTDPWLCTGFEVGTEVDSLNAALRVITGIRRRGHHRIVVKQSLGLAGHNAIRLWETEVLETQRRWMTQALRHGTLVVEPWLERELDFSLQLEMTRRGLQLCGYAGMMTDLRGQYRGNWAEPAYAKRLPVQVAALLKAPVDIAVHLHRLYQELREFLQAKLSATGFLGPVGVDAFVYRTASGCRLKPIVEINPRYTMGRVTLELMKWVCPGRHGTFRLLRRAELGENVGQDFVRFARWMEQHSPVQLKGNPVARINAGALVLNDPAQAQVCLAVFDVGDAAAMD